MAAQRILAFIDTLEFDVMDRAAEECAYAILPYCVSEGPTPGSDHPYSTGLMSQSWTVERIGPALYLVRNAQDYSGYADEGYTRYGGKASADPWRNAGATDYTQQAINAVRPEWERITREALTYATG